MLAYSLTDGHIEEFIAHLRDLERTESTIKKYRRDIQDFLSFLPPEGRVDKNSVMLWKCKLAEENAAGTVNSKLAALNGLFGYLGWHDCRVKPIKRQRRVFRDKQREMTQADYFRLLNAAKAAGNQRLYYIMETLCATGIRISELQFITVEALAKGYAAVNCKGKLRTVILTGKLCRVLQKFCSRYNIVHGSVFVTRTGKPLDRSNIWRELQKLAIAAKVDCGKVFPHNFRHLFAIAFYSLDKDIAKLADLLGHASIETTRIYIMESSREHERKMARLGFVV